MASTSKTCTIRTRAFLNNRLLQRKQMAIEVVHPGRGTVPLTELRDKLTKVFKVADPNQIILYGFRTSFGGGKSKGFAFVYDTLEIMKRYEPKFRLIRLGMAKKNPVARKQRKDRKNRAKKLKGKKKATVVTAKK
eukprot:TRINITY_DN338_c0_g1_i2.p1 TRINITY_DN338_c0_g1~~TRINITY_DN338_c0_g1_i2.p1  ORF type:complete len:135 (+),score=27.99 TRINITY_DN338_c0_g1_i2:110-514(+)